MRRHWLSGLPLAALVATSPVGAGAQVDPAMDEGRLLRRAATLEARGQNEEAAELLENLLDGAPASSGALFALERVLRPLGRVGDLLPRVDRYLAEIPRSPAARYLKLRVLVETDSVAGLSETVDAWIRAEPNSAEPYREGAKVLGEAFDLDSARSVLEAGREALGQDRSLALELGSVLLELGEVEGAVAEWSAAIGADAEGTTEVARRVAAADGSRGEVAGLLVTDLVSEPTTTARRRAAVRLALENGLAERAIAVAEDAAEGLEGGSRRAFLDELARDAERLDELGVALWAYDRVRQSRMSGGARRALEQKISSIALDVGDTAVAIAAKRRLAETLNRGSAERRRVVAELIRLEATRAEAGSLFRMLEEFRDEFPDAPEVDGLASAVASGLRSSGREEEAHRVLEGVEGPESSVERGYLLFDEGDIEGGREALLAALPGLDPDQATSVIQLTTLLEGSGAAAPLLARSAGLARRGRAEEALRAIDGGVAELPPELRPVVLAHASRLADDAGLDGEAARLRERILAEHGTAPEAAEATLELARFRARAPEGVDEAMRLLEELILLRPQSPVVPSARRELQRLRNRGSGGALR